MRLKLTLDRAQGPADLMVTVDTTVTVEELARTIATRDPQSGGSVVARPTLRIDGSSTRELDPSSTVADAGLQSGQAVSVVDGGGHRPTGGGAAVATLHVLAGPDAGASFPLVAGANQIGRDRRSDVVLSDSLVSKHHARITVGESIEIVDLGSSNGVLIGGELALRATLRPEDTVMLGDSLIRVQRVVGAGVVHHQQAGVEFNRSPHIDDVYEGEKFEVPEAPRRPGPQRIPIVPLVAPIFMGAVMLALGLPKVTIVFLALSPILMVGNVVENRIFGKKQYAAAVVAYRESLAALEETIVEAAAREVAVRKTEHPALSELGRAAIGRDPLLWYRRPDQRGFLELRLGVGARPSRSSIELPKRGDMEAELWAELTELRARHRQVADVPIPGVLRSCGSLGVAGSRQDALAAARAVVAGLVSSHSPAELVLAGLASSSAAGDWDWLKWLPHVGSDHSPISVDHLASSPGPAARLVSALDELIETRLADRGSPTSGDPIPAVVLLVDDAPIELSRLVELAEHGREAGVHLLWIEGNVASLPAACRTFLDLERGQPGGVGLVVEGERVDQVGIEQLSLQDALALARSLAPVVDAGAPIDDDSDLPRSVSLVTLAGPDLIESSGAVIDRWRTSSSIPAEFAGIRRKKDHSLRAFVGAAAGQSFFLDLREHGPHALVGGTTGSGKSEFLQSWVTGLAVEHSAARVTFLFVDYKGGAAFSECVSLPHSVGLVTDLSPHLVRRALTSLRAELRHREHLLQSKKAKDLLELERRGDPEAPPSLVIVVDEFAALVKEVPEFVDGVVDVAQRGRSLGLHLILATQRPAGVIKDNLRANTNLRVALRMADEDDSTDVVGSKLAAGFDPGVPGRGVAKLGPGRLTPFQSGYVGGWTSSTPPPPIITVQELRFGLGPEWEETGASADAPPPTGPTDLQLLVSQVREAHRELGMPEPRRPWLDGLADAYDLARAPQSRTDASLIFGIQDEPEAQRQVPASFEPDRDGNMVVYGTGGAGKSGFLRTIAIVAGLGLRGGPCHVYGFDFGARGLQMLEPLDHVGAIVNGDDHERIQRLLRDLRQTIDDRAARYAAVNASTIVEYRAAANAPDEPRIILLVDNMAAFRQAYELGPYARWFDVFQGIAADGRQVGVHVVVSADRPGSVPTALTSVIQRQLTLRLTTDNDYLTLDVPVDALPASSPPGRGFVDGHEVQVTVLGGSANSSRQATTIERLAEQIRSSAGRAPAPPVQRLSDRVVLGELPPIVDDLPTIGIADDDLSPMAIVPEDILLVVGPAQSGKTSFLAAVALSLVRSGRGRCLVYLGAGRSLLRSVVTWEREAIGLDDVADAARELAEQIASGAAAPDAVFIEDLALYLNTAADGPLQDLLKAARANGVFVVTDCETSSLASWPLHMAAKAGRHGVALQPDQHDGDNVFKTPFPRVARADFPPGRGFYVRRGQFRRFQSALPEVDAT